MLAAHEPMKEDDHNPYAPPRAVLGSEEAPRTRQPQGSNEGVTAWQDDGRIVMPATGGELPDRCVVCNKPTDFKRTTRFHWHPQGYYVLLFAGWVGYLFALYFVRRRAVVDLGLCAEHEARRKSGQMLTLAGVGAGLFLVLLRRFIDEPVVLSLMALTMIVTLVLGYSRSRVARVWRIDESHVWLNAGPAFVRSLPHSPDGDEDEPSPAARKKKQKRAEEPILTVDDELRAMLGEEESEEEPAGTAGEEPSDEGQDDDDDDDEGDEGDDEGADGDGDGDGDGEKKR